MHPPIRKIILGGGNFHVKIRAFWGKYHVKFRHFVNFSCIYFPVKMSCSPKLIELLRLCPYPNRVILNTAGEAGQAGEAGDVFSRPSYDSPGVHGGGRRHDTRLSR